MTMKAVTVAGATFTNNGQEKFEEFNSDDHQQLFETEIVRSSSEAQMFFRSRKDKVFEFMKVLALAHECVPDTTSDGVVVSYKGLSPDEV
jgi:hypothetical protein